MWYSGRVPMNTARAFQTEHQRHGWDDLIRTAHTALKRPATWPGARHSVHMCEPSREPLHVDVGR